MSKTVIIASAKANAAIRIENFEGTTFADLKANPQFQSVYGTGEAVEVVIKPGNITLRDDDSVLPTGNFSAFIIPTKNKAGVSSASVRELARTIKREIYAKAKMAEENHIDELRDEMLQVVDRVYTIGRATPTDVTQQPSAVSGAQPTILTDPELTAALAEAYSM